MSGETGADIGSTRAGADAQSHAPAARHDHTHGHGHTHSHDHAVSGVARSLPKPQAPGLSLMRASLGERLLLATVLSALLWGAIAGVLWT